MKRLVLLAWWLSAAAAAFSWEVPSWDPRLTQPGAVEEYVDKTWCGHVQGMCVNSNALYFAFHTHILKTDWNGHFLKRVQVVRHKIGRAHV